MCLNDFNLIDKWDNLTLQERINHLQRLVVLHSYLYYQLDDSVISDDEYGVMTKELAKCKNEFPILWKNSTYYKQFGDDYEGSTGFTLYYDLDEDQKDVIESIAKARERYKKER